MGLRKVFSKKDPSEDEIRKNLTDAGISTKATTISGRQSQFGAFQEYAQQQNSRKQGMKPVNPYANTVLDSSRNPYANGNVGNGTGNSNGNSGGHNNNPYGSTNSSSNPYGTGASTSNPYGSTNAPSNPYGSGASKSYGSGAPESNRYGSTTQTANSTPYSGSIKPSPYSTQRRSNPTSQRSYDEESLDLNRIPSHQVGESKVARRPQKEIDLNDLPEEDDLNLDVPQDLPQDYDEVNSEDEEMEAIKQDIRFVKQESVASTRNTLRMAQEADASAINTLGVLGSQSERLYLAEQNLLLADTQTKIADAKVGELNRLNRSIFIPAYGNPFNKKSRLRQQEDRIKAEKSQEKYQREQTRNEMYLSEQRIKEGITNASANSELHQKYRLDNHLQQAKRYQFENDSEDDEIEKELASNLDQIGLYAKKLKQSATTMGQEVESQNARLNQIEEDADRLDINVHMNTTRLSNIR